MERLKADGREKDVRNAELRRQLVELASEVSRLRQQREEVHRQREQSLRVQ